MYEASAVTVMGRIGDLTLGGGFSRADGMSGNTGNKGQGQGGTNP